MDSNDQITRELQIRDLEAVARIDLGDFFRFEIDRGDIDIDERGSLTIAVESFIGGAEFEPFDIDLAPFDANTESESSSLNLPIDLELEAKTVQVKILRLEPQLADKICAMYEKHGERRTHSSRWRDLADVAMIAMQTSDIAAADLRRHLKREKLRREAALDAGLPETFVLPPEQVQEWRQNWGGRGRTVPIDLDQALDVGALFISPLLDGSALGKWNADDLVWVA